MVARPRVEPARGGSPLGPDRLGGTHVVLGIIHHRGALGPSPLGLPAGFGQDLAHRPTGLGHLGAVEVAQQVEEDHGRREEEISHVPGDGPLADEERHHAPEESDAVENEVDPSTEDGAGTLEPCDLTVHAVQHETEVEEQGAQQQPCPADLDKRRHRKTHRGQQAQYTRPQRQLIRGDVGSVGGPNDQAPGQGVHQEDGPPGILGLVGFFLDLRKSETRHSEGSPAVPDPSASHCP